MGKRFSTKTKSGQNFARERVIKASFPLDYICAFNFAPITCCEKERSFSMQTLYERSEHKHDKRKYRNAFNLQLFRVVSKSGVLMNSIRFAV